METNMSLDTKGEFPVINFDKLPSGMERFRTGRTARTKYDWEGLKVKQGIKVPGDRYASAMASAQTFAKSHPHDEEQEKKLKQHIRGRVMAERKRIEAEGGTWTDEMEANVQPDPSVKDQFSRRFATMAVRDPDTNEIIKSKGLKDSRGNTLADEYLVIRVS